MKYIDQSLARHSARRKRLAADVATYYNNVAERDILKVVTDTCDAARIPYVRNYRTKIYTDKKTGEKKLAKIPDHQKGVPDVMVPCLDRLTLWIETKATDGKLSEEQIRWKTWLLARGHEYHAPRTVEEAHNVSKRILELGR